MASKQLTFHLHYTYKMKFGIVCKETKFVHCDVKTQEEVRRKHLLRSFWKEHPDEPLLLSFASEENCIGIEVLSGTRQAGAAKSSRDFVVEDVLSTSSIGLIQSTSSCGILGSARIHALFQRGVIQSEVLQEEIAKMKTEIACILTSNDEESADKMRAVLTCVDKTNSDLCNREVKIDKEIQFNSWMFDQIDVDLRQYGYVVEKERENKCVVPNVNEYSSSFSDCVIYHEASVFKSHVSGIVVTSESDEETGTHIPYHDDSLDLGNDVFEVMANTIEMKSIKLSEAAINECFFNMFGSGTRLATMALKMGHIVNRVVMYGIVASMQDPQGARILQLTIDFAASKCTYYKVVRKFSFVEALNRVLAKLKY